MIVLRPFRIVRLALVFGLGSVLASSCVVDKSGLVFDDDEYQAALGEGGEGGEGGDAPGSGGGLLGNGGLGGRAGSGGLTGSGGLGLGGAGNLCEPNAMQCDGKQVELCSNDQWIPIGGPCPNACVNGLCTGVCNPGADECLSSIQTQHCNDVGEWEDEYCEFACVGGTCGGECRPGDRGCEGDSPTLCGEDGQWVTQDVCPGTCEQGVCVGACVLGETQCGGDAGDPYQVTCDAPDWETSTHTDCEFTCEQSTGECGGECVPFSSTCATDTAWKTCELTAYYGEPQACPFVCDDATGACGGECVPGTQQCAGTTIQTCDGNGAWRDGDTCSGEKPICLDPIDAEPSCVKCAPNAEMCSPVANQVLTCNDSGNWEKGEECPFDKDAICWKGACELAKDVCPTICGKFNCPNGCVDPSTQWFCTIAGDFKVDQCGLGSSCNAGTCE